MASLRLFIDASAAKSGAEAFRRATDSIKASGTDASRSSAAVGDAFGRLKTQAIGLGTAFAGFAGIRAALSVVSDYEKQMRLLGRASRASAEDFESLARVARKMGGTTEFSARQTASAMVELAKAGYDTAAITASVGDVLKLGSAAMLGLDQSAKIVVNSLSQFGLGADQAGRAASALVYAADASTSSVEELASGLSYAGPVARAFGIDIEQTLAVLAILADAGIDASSAGTALRSSLLALASPTDDARAALKDMGLTFEDVNPAAHDLAQIAEALARGVASLANPLDAAAKLSAIVGDRNAAAALTIGNNAARVRELTVDIRSQNDAHAETAAALDGTVTRSYANLKAVLEEAALATGDSGLRGATVGLLETLTGATRIVLGVEGALASASLAAEVLAVALTVLIVRASLLAATRLLGFLLGFSSAAISAAYATAGLSGAINALTLAMARNPIGLLVTALSVAAGTALIFSARSRDAAAAMRDQADAAEQLRGRLYDIAQLEGRERDPASQQSATLQRLGLLEGLRKDAATSASGSLSHEQLRAGGLSDSGIQSLAAQRARESAKFSGRDANQGDYLAALRGGAVNAEQALKTIDEEIARVKSTLQTFGAVGEESVDKANSALEKYLETLREEASILAIRGASIDESTRLQAIQTDLIRATNALEKDGRQLTKEEVDTIRESIAARYDLAEAFQAEKEAASDTAAATLALAQAQRQNADEAAKALAAKREGIDNYLKSLADENEVLRDQALGGKAAGDALAALQGLMAVGGDQVIPEHVSALNELIDARRRHLETINSEQEGLQRIDEAYRRQQQALADLVEQTQEAADEMAGAGLYGDAYTADQTNRKIDRDVAAASLGAAPEEVERAEELGRVLKDLNAQLLEVDKARSVAEGISGAFADGFESIITGASSAKEALKSFLADALSILFEVMVRQQLIASLSSFLTPAAGAGAGGNAKGNAFSGGNLVAFARGGIVDGPTTFPMAGGRTGLMGEAGAEAIMPLKRDASGRLGVTSNGGGRPIVVNMTVHAADANSFRRSRRQIQDDLKRATTNLQT